MKKILSVLCVLAFIASFACISASADAFNMVAAEVKEGDTTFTVDVVAHLPEGGDVTQVGLLVTVPEGLTLDNFKKQYTDEGMYTCSQAYTENPYMILWVAGTASLPVGDTVLCTLTFTAAEAFTAESAYEIALAFEPQNMPATVAGEAVSADVAGCTVVAVAETEAPVVSTTAAPVVDESEAPASSEATEAPASSETEATVPTATTGAPATGDNTTMMFAVVALMVVALGAAVVVKKVNVK